MIELLKGDYLEIMRTIEDNSIDIILTDPPYKQEFHGRGMVKYRPNYKKIADYGGNVDFDYTEFLDESFRVLRKINFFSFCNKETKYDLITYAKQKGYSYQELSFCKTSPAPFINNQWLPDTEYGLHIFKNLEVMGDYHTKRSFSIMANFKEKGVNHPTPKKVSEVERILLNISNKGQTVLDPFMGSGTTGIACKNLDRNFIGIELNEDYFKLAKNRIEEHKVQKNIF